MMPYVVGRDPDTGEIIVRDRRFYEFFLRGPKSEEHRIRDFVQFANEWFHSKSATSTNMSGHPISQRIRDWFQSEATNQGYKQSNLIADEINKTIAGMPEPLPESAAAWKAWDDFEQSPSHNDPGLHIAMNLCAYAEWCADKDLGLTTEPFKGVPCLVITRCNDAIV